VRLRSVILSRNTFGVGTGRDGQETDIGIVAAVSLGQTDNGRRDLAEEIILVVITGADLPGD
jgi:hypothetical protein